MDWQRKITVHQEVFEQLKAQESGVVEIGARLVTTLVEGGTIFIAGNGGSAADAQHFAAELTGRFVHERRALSAVALTTDTSALTAIANDYGYEQIFARQLSALARPRDAFIAISTSGNSANILEALTVARAKQVTTIGLSGGDGGAMRRLCDGCMVVPSAVTAHIQEAHIFILHHFCALIDAHFVVV